MGLAQAPAPAPTLTFNQAGRGTHLGRLGLRLDFSFCICSSMGSPHLVGVGVGVRVGVRVVVGVMTG